MHGFAAPIVANGGNACGWTTLLSIHCGTWIVLVDNYVKHAYFEKRRHTLPNIGEYCQKFWAVKQLQAFWSLHSQQSLNLKLGDVLAQPSLNRLTSNGYPWAATKARAWGLVRGFTSSCMSKKNCCGACVHASFLRAITQSVSTKMIARRSGSICLHTYIYIYIYIYAWLQNHRHTKIGAQ